MEYRNAEQLEALLDAKAFARRYGDFQVDESCDGVEVLFTPHIGCLRVGHHLFSRSELEELGGPDDLLATLADGWEDLTEEHPASDVVDLSKADVENVWYYREAIKNLEESIDALRRGMD